VIPHIRKRKRFLQTCVLSGALFVLVFFFYLLFRFAAFRFFHYDLASQEVSILLASVFVSVFFYKPLDHVIFLMLKWGIFRSHTRDYDVLTQMVRASRGILDSTELSNLIVNTFGETWRVSIASVLLLDKEQKVYRLSSAFGMKSYEWRKIEFKETSGLIELLKIRKIPIDRERTIKSFAWQEANYLTHEFEQLHATFVIPIFTQGELIGTINLQTHQASRLFAAGEIKAFISFSKEMGVAFRNALTYEELEDDHRELMKIQSDLLYSAQHSAIAQLAVGLAHEIHNPLTVISGKAQVLLLKKNQLAYDEHVEDVLKTIVKQTKRAADITRKLLMFSDSHRAVIEPIDFESLINDTVALLSYQVSLDQIQVVKRFSKPFPKWRGSLTKMREAFLNLFLNAVQAIGTKGIVQVSVKHKKEDHLIEIRISDSGPGIKEEDLARVFHPFFTTRHGATGLGLFVTQQIVCGYGGSVRAERGLAKGAAFIVELPCGDLNQPKDENPRSEANQFSGDVQAVSQKETGRSRLEERLNH
jgi:signal transduction histidine kinase